MFNTPYETTLLSMKSVQKMKSQLAQMKSIGLLKQLTGHDADHPDFEIWCLVEGGEDVPAWYLPLVGDESSHSATPIFVDARSYGSVLSDSDGKVINNGRNESFNLVIASAILTGNWLKDSQGIINVSDIPMTVYASTMSDALQRRIGLDHNATFNVMITFQLFYQSLGYRNPADMLKPDNMMNTAVSLAKRMNVPTDTYITIIEKLDVKDLMSFPNIVSFIVNQGWSPRLKNITSADMIGLIGNIWVGQGSPKEVIAASLEFPPIWISLCYIIARNTFYQKLPLGQIIKRLDRGNSMKNFIQRVNYYLR